MIYADDVENLTIRLPNSRFGGLLTASGFPAPDPNFVDSAFCAPVGSPFLREIARGKNKACVLVSDATRNVPTSSVLPRILEELELGEIKRENIALVVATGVHRPATKQEMKTITGESLWGKVRIQNHDPYTLRNLVNLGTTSRGTPVEVNRTVEESDLRIVVGKVEPHEFAGFSGGRKSVLPGVSSERTILINHRPDMVLHPSSAIGVLEGNPISEDMFEAAQMLWIHFCVNILSDAEGAPFSIFCGDLEKSHSQAVLTLKKYIALPLGKRLRIAVTTPGNPLNINLYQSVKAIIAAAPIMDRNGVLILYSRCTEGVGSDDMPRPFMMGATFDDIVKYLNENYRIQMDHSLLLCKILQTGLRVILVSKNIDPEIAKRMKLIPANSLDMALEMAFELVGGNEKIYFFPCPQRFLPFITGKSPYRESGSCNR